MIKLNLIKSNFEDQFFMKLWKRFVTLTNSLVPNTCSGSSLTTFSPTGFGS